MYVSSHGGDIRVRKLLVSSTRLCPQLLLSQHQSLQPTAQTYASLMRPCEHDGDVKMAFELYHEALAHKDLALHVDLFNTLISVCTRARDFAAAENIFDEMREKVCAFAIRSRALSVRVAASCFCVPRPQTSCYAAPSVSVPATFLVPQGVKPKSATYLRYIYACFVRREPEKAYQMLLTMEKDWRVPESKDYMKMCARSNPASVRACVPCAWPRRALCVRASS